MCVLTLEKSEPPAGHAAATVNLPTPRQLDRAAAAAAASRLRPERPTEAIHTPRRSMTPIHVPGGETVSVGRLGWPQRSGVLPSRRPKICTPGPGSVGRSRTLRTPDLQRSVGRSRTSRTSVTVVIGRNGRNGCFHWHSRPFIGPL